MTKQMFRVISGKYKGRIGYCEFNNAYGSVMFYPIEGIHPYRVCLMQTEVEAVV